MEPSLLYLPSAFALGALHALEPGHAKTLTAAYLIGIKGNKSDAVILGLSVALFHSLVVIIISTIGIYLSRASFTGAAIYYLQISSGALVTMLGLWLFLHSRGGKKLGSNDHHHEHHDSHAHHYHDHSHGHHAHPTCTDDSLQHDSHAMAHLATIPAYVKTGTRPSILQLVSFGAAGGLVPCPAAVTVMLLAVSLNQTVNGLLLVVGFSLGLASTLVAIGLCVVTGIKALSSNHSLDWVSKNASQLSAIFVILSGVLALSLATK